MASPPVPRKLNVSDLVYDVGNTSSTKSRRAAGPSSFHGQHLPPSSDWIDVDDSPPRSERESSKITTGHSTRRYRERLPLQVDRKDSDLSRYFPQLTRILEGSESTSSINLETPRTSRHRRHRERSSTRRSNHQDESRSSLQRRPIKRRTTTVPSRRLDSLHSGNSSLLSVLTSLTALSERSSGSGSTITQSSYNRRDSGRSRTPKARAGSTRSGPVDMASRISPPESLNVFDYMVKADECNHGRSIRSTSSSSSQYAPSDADSNDDPSTPSSRSSLPSPTATRNGSVGELPPKYEFQSAASSSSVRSNSHSPGASLRSMHRKRSMSDVAEECDDDDEEEADHDEEDHREASAAPSAIPAHVSHSSRRSSSRSSQHSSSGSTHKDGTRRQDKRYAMHTPDSSHLVGPPYGQPRSQSSSSTGSGRDVYAAWEMAMQQYQYPSPAPTPPSSILPVPSPSPHQAGHFSSLPSRPPVPDAPDLTQRTLTGYEQLALEIASTASPVRPIYRKFEYLSHRILLHLQDELSELEEQLRIIDEIIAQLEPTDTDPSSPRSTSSSRRGDTYYGMEIHHRRTSLLGRIFLKTEQYSRAMRAYAEMSRDSLPADQAQVDLYRAWLAKHAPVHELETRFLNQSPDLIVPGAQLPLSPSRGATAPSEMSKWQACCAILPFALMLPVLLFSAIPSAIGRLLVVSLIAIGVFIVAATTPRLRALISVRDWAVASGLYVLVMAAVAGCVPGHA